MSIRTWLIVLAVAVGFGAGQSIETNYAPCPVGRVCRIGNECWINGVWYNPCPRDAANDPGSDPSPIPQPPG